MRFYTKIYIPVIYHICSHRQPLSSEVFSTLVGGSGSNTFTKSTEEDWGHKKRKSLAPCKFPFLKIKFSRLKPPMQPLVLMLCVALVCHCNLGTRVHWFLDWILGEIVT